MEDLDGNEQADMDVGFIGSLTPQDDDDISAIMLEQLGALGNKYRREARKTFRHLFSEVYSLRE